MGKYKSHEIRCTKVRRKNGRERKCNRFLARLDEFEIFLVCPDCGERHMIGKLPLGQLKRMTTSAPIFKKETK